MRLFYIPESDDFVIRQYLHQSRIGRGPRMRPSADASVHCEAHFVIQRVAERITASCDFHRPSGSVPCVDLVD
jgi:hypothetical protein